jgi:hypothetical protein
VAGLLVGREAECQGGHWPAAEVVNVILPAGSEPPAAKLTKGVK